MEAQILPAWQFGYGMFIYGLDKLYPDDHWLYYYNSYDDELGGVKFYKRSGGLINAYLNPQGEIYIEDTQFSDWSDMQKYDGNLFDLLIEQINELENDYQKYIHESK